jgi:hypothetical protein
MGNETTIQATSSLQRPRVPRAHASFIQLKESESEQTSVFVAFVEFDRFQKSLRLVTQHCVTSSFSVTTDVDGMQDGKSAADAEHAADKISNQDTQ